MVLQRFPRHLRFLHGSEQPQHRRFVFPGYLPTAIANVSHINAMIAANACKFSKLPLIAGHSLIYAWFEALADGLEACDDFMIMKLHEAGLTANIRMRCTDSHKQVMLDAHVWSENIRSEYHAGCADLVSFIERTMMIPGVLPNGNLPSAVKFSMLLQELGITWKGKKIDKSFAMGMLAMAPVVQSKKCIQAFAPLRDAHPKIVGEMSKMMRLAQVAKASYGDFQCDQVAYTLESLFVSLMRKDITEAEITTEMLVGSNKDEACGFLQLSALKRTILEYMFRAVRRAADHEELRRSSDIIISEVLPKFECPRAAFMSVGRHDRREQNAESMMNAQEQPTCEDDDTNLAKLMKSIGNKGAKMAVSLFHDIYAGVHDEELAWR